MWRTIAGPFKEFGLLAGMLYAIDRVFHRLSPRLRLHVYELMVQPITGQALLPPNLVRNLTFVELGRDHPDTALMPVFEGVVPSRFEQGARCLGVYRKGKLIGYMWFCSGRYEEDEVRCTYHLADRERSVFDFDFYVFPEHRMGLGFMAVWHGANLFLGERGIHSTFSRLTRFNTASRRAHAHLGWQRVGRLLCLQAWSVELTLATLRPFVGLTWTRRQRVHLRLAPDVLRQGARHGTRTIDDAGRAAGAPHT